MAIGDVRAVTTGDCTDLSFVDTGMYDTTGYGSVYLLDAERPAVVESGLGTEHDRVLDALDVVGIDRRAVEVIAVTHVHLDHAGGVGFLAEACPNAEVVVHERGAPHLADPERLVRGTEAAVGDLWPFYTSPEPVPEERLRPVADGERVDLGDHELRVAHAPGHAPHQVVYHDPANDATFTGDAAGVWLPERGAVRATTPPWSFDLEQCLADLHTIGDVDPTTLLYSHFGPHPDPGTALDAARTALVEWVEAVRARRADAEDDEAVVDHFVGTTPCVDAWGEAMARPVAAVDVRGVLDYLDERP
ncbi:MBL fold metallo-hydrolase [Halomarina ordinaria]|uniref:MBL fold metallo-hydrolase n=1 Tax=Halomarina ordinaria TaxID=3033939 RepID=A0ABD5UCG1_9EURY|nr:MBL fold metallo-hydrolase [Halomarina sp. PSRA2]